MLAVDTNVIVRSLTDDDPVQSLAARTLVATGQIFVCKTVLLEAEWILRRVYKFRKPRVIAKLIAFVGLPGVMLENAFAVQKALTWTEQGMDFGDALHLAATEHCDEFVTFDRRFAKAARPLSDRTIRIP